MGSEKSRQSPSAQDRQKPDPDELAMELELARHRTGRQSGSMRVREAAVMRFPTYAEEDYPALVEGILGHVFGVLRDLGEQQVDIMILRDDTRAALARLKAA
jgi:hypothetical protein